MVAGAVFGTSWMVGLMLPPYLLSRAIDDGLERGDLRSLAGWCGALLGIGALNAWLAIMRHRTMSRVRMDGMFRTVRVVVAHAARLGATLPRRVTAGEVVTIGIADVRVLAQTLTITGPGVGAVLAYLVAAALLLSVSPLLAVGVLLGVPLLAVLIGPLLNRLQGIETRYRERQATLSGRFGDIVGGLRILNGLGGKAAFAERYRRGSAALRAEGYRVGTVASWIQALGTGLPVVFLAVVTWLAARMAATDSITVGGLVAVYGYAAVLAVPVSFFLDCAYEFNHGIVAARRVVRFLTLEPELVDDGPRVPGPWGPAVLHDPGSGVAVAPGVLTALVSARPAESAAVVDRLGRFADSAVTWGSVRLDEIALPEVRDRILVADNEADLFAGTLRELLSGRCERDEAAIVRAVHAAVARDVVDGLPAGIDSGIDTQARNLSGGQRQRIRLARALLAEPEVLLATEPTSALDAHTEARVADRLRTVRAGRTTVVTSTSPLLLDRADTVHYLVDGRVVATGRHQDLLADQPGYRRLVARDAEDGSAAGDEAAPPMSETLR
ncbi:MAG: ABC transporter ATP-binding protein [Actinocatenispora sp.]